MILVLTPATHQVAGILTGPRFTQEYTRGNGRLSSEFEEWLKERANEEVRAELQAAGTPSQVLELNFANSSAVQRHIQLPTSLTNGFSTASTPNGPRTFPRFANTVHDPIVIDDDDENQGGGPSNATQPVRPLAPNSHPAPQTPVPGPTITIQKSLRVRSLAIHKGYASSPWFREQRQPYLWADERKRILAGSHRSLPEADSLDGPVTIHANFTANEVETLRNFTRQVLEIRSDKKRRDPRRDLYKLFKGKQGADLRARLSANFPSTWPLPRRSPVDVNNFLRDVLSKRVAEELAALSLERADTRSNNARGFARNSRVHTLLLSREISGQRGYRSMRKLVNFQNEFKKSREDELALRQEWTDCAGDIATIVWVTGDTFICGTTEHSDTHNQQYNKPGNLVLGSCRLKTLRAYPEHRIIRPVVHQGENSTDAMRQTQDPWLYSSVVSSDYDPAQDRAFTSSFDRTVKIWKVEPRCASMRMLGEWKHEGNVNFVAATKNGVGMVATASDVAVDAIRIYIVDDNNISDSPFRSYSCSRVTDEAGVEVSTEKWAYFPATMQWGVAPEVQHLLLVGYSPRTRTGDDNDIPELRLHTGELRVWDGRTSESWRITSATTQNVFEVLWHPTQPCFAAATSPLGQDLDRHVKTQVRIFKQDPDSKAFSPVKALDCPAVDINELTIM